MGFNVQDEKEYGHIRLANAHVSWIIRNAGPTAFAIYCELQAHADGNTGKCYPGFRRLQEHTGFDRKTIARAIQTLEWCRLVIVIRSTGATSNYRLTHSREWIPDNQGKKASGGANPQKRGKISTKTIFREQPSLNKKSSFQERPQGQEGRMGKEEEGNPFDDDAGWS